MPLVRRRVTPALHLNEPGIPLDIEEVKMTISTATAEPAKIIAMPQRGGQSSFLPKHLPRHFIQFENLIYTIMDQFAEEGEYTGGQWKFMNLSNGGMIMIPPEPNTQGKRYTLSTPNYWTGHVDSHVAGVIITLYALSYLANKYQEDSLIEKYWALKDYVAHIPFCSQIERAID